MALTFGVHTGQQNCSLKELRRLWQFVDQAGFDWRRCGITSMNPHRFLVALLSCAHCGDLLGHILGDRFCGRLHVSLHKDANTERLA